MRNFILTVIAMGLLSFMACSNLTTAKATITHPPTPIITQHPSPTTQYSSPNTPKYIPQRGDFTFKTRVCVIDDGEGMIRYDTIVTYLTDARGHTDTLISWALPLDIDYWEKNAIGQIKEEDFNFDGFPDLQIGLGPFNSYGNYTYDVFFWNESQHRFVRNESFDRAIMYSPEVFEDEKIIMSIWRLGNEMEVKKFRWEGDSLVEFFNDSFRYGEDDEE